MAPGISRGSAAKSFSVRTSIRTGVFAVPIKRASLSGDISVNDDMMRPRRKKRDAILGHVASWGDRRTPMSDTIKRNRCGLSMRKQERFGATARSFPQTVVIARSGEPSRNTPDLDGKAGLQFRQAQRDLLKMAPE